MKKQISIKEFASKGGKARMATMTAKQRSALAKKAADIRHGNLKQNKTIKNEVV